tara:strand:- start:709 stop:948 length:240 start_codon:yes stop_codon:yes gene_type:complete
MKLFSNIVNTRKNDMNKNDIIEGFLPEILFIVKNGFYGCAIAILAFGLGIFISLGKYSSIVIAIAFFIAAIIVIPSTLA